MKYSLCIEQGYSRNYFTLDELGECQKVIETLAGKGDEDTQFKIFIRKEKEELMDDAAEALKEIIRKIEDDNNEEADYTGNRILTDIERVIDRLEGER